MAVRVGFERIKALILLPAALLLAAVAHALSSHTESEPRPRAEIPEWYTQERAILWVVRSKDFHSCRTAGGILRNIQRSPGLAAPLTLVAVAADSGWAASLLRSERLIGTVYVVSEREYRQELGGSFTPMLYVLQNGRIRTSVRVPRNAAEDSVRISLMRALVLVTRRSAEHPRPI